jgi:hypothetical protein
MRSLAEPVSPSLAGCRATKYTIQMPGDPHAGRPIFIALTVMRPELASMYRGIAVTR